MKTDCNIYILNKFNVFILIVKFNHLAINSILIIKALFEYKIDINNDD